MPATLTCDRCGSGYVPADGDFNPKTEISIPATVIMGGASLPGGIYKNFVCPTCQTVATQILAGAFPFSDLAAATLPSDQLAAAKSQAVSTTASLVAALAAVQAAAQAAANIVTPAPQPTPAPSH